MEKTLYFIVLSAFLGTNFFSIDIGIINLNLYRISLYFMVFYLLANNLLVDKKLELGIKNTQKSIIGFYFLWLIYSIYSLAWVLNLKTGIKDLFFIGTGFLCIWLFTTFIKEEEKFKKIFTIIFIMIILHNIWGWFELQTGIYFFGNLAKIDRYTQFGFNRAARVPVTMFANTNDFSTLMTFGVFISLITLLNSKKTWMKILSFLTIISSILLVIESGSRANTLGISLGLAFILFLFLYKRMNKFLMLSLGLLGFILIILYPPINVIIIGILNKYFGLTREATSSVASNTTRLNLIKNGFAFLFDTFGFGTGVGNIEYWMETRQVFYVGEVYNIHNWWMEILTGYGIIVFIGYVYTYALKIKTMVTAYFESDNTFIRNSSLGLFGFLISYIISSISSSSNMNSEWIWLFWAILISFIGYIINDFEGNKKIEKNQRGEIYEEN